MIIEEHVIAEAEDPFERWDAQRAELDGHMVAEGLRTASDPWRLP